MTRNSNTAIVKHPSVIKRAGHNEMYHESKVHGSVTRACRAVKAFEGEASMIADRVASAVTAWAIGKNEVTSRDIHSRALASLIAFHPAAAYAYDVHDAIL